MRLAEDLQKLDDIPRSVHNKSPIQRISRQIRHILAPTDLSNESRKSIKYAMRLAQHFQAKLTLLHVCEMPGASADDSHALASKEFQQHDTRAKLSLLSLHDIVRAQYSNTEPCLRTGDPGKQIFSTARSLGADLIVFSTHDFAWLRHFVDDGNSEEILRAIPCPVLVLYEDHPEDSSAVPLVKSDPTTHRKIKFGSTGSEGGARWVANTAGPPATQSAAAEQS